MTFVANLWCGRLSLAKTGILYGLFGMVLLVAPVLYIHGTNSPLRGTPVMAGISLLLLIYSVFIGICIWRSANNHSGFAGRYLAKGSILFVAAQVVAGLV